MKRLMTKGGRIAVSALAMLLLITLAGYQASQAQDDGSNQITNENHLYLPLIQSKADNDENPSSPNNPTETKAPLLLDSIDVASFGDVDVQVLVSASPVISSSSIWQEARVTSMVVRSKISELPTVVWIDSVFYQFDTPDAARAMIEALPSDPSLLDPGLAQDLDKFASTWRVSYLLDSEGLPMYSVFFVTGNSVTQVNATVLSKNRQFGQKLLNYAAKQLVSKSMGQDLRYLPVVSSSETPTNFDNTLSTIQQLHNSPSTLVSTSNTNQIDSAFLPAFEIITRFGGIDQLFEPHQVAQWRLPNGRDFRYSGAGDTCTESGDNGCIARWGWNGECNADYTCMGISKTFIFNHPIDATKPENYQASFDISNQLLIVGPLTLSSTSARVNENVTARFKIKNDTGQPITLDLTAGARRGSDWSGEQADFPTVSINLQPGQDYSYQQSRSFASSGNYFAEPVAKINGAWGGIAGSNRVTFTIGGTTATPIPSATPTRVPLPTNPPTPSGDAIELVNPQSYNVQPGQRFNPSVTIHINSGQLLVSRGDHLHAVPESGDNTLSALPVQAVKTNVSAGGTYVFNDPSFQMTAPSTPGTYSSKWQMRIGGVHVGPVITIVVNVGAVPSTPVPEGWQAQWYSNRDLNSRCGNIESIPDLMFFKNWGGGAPSGCPTENWSAKLIRDINFPGGDYLFHCHSDDGCIVLVEGVKVIDCWWDKSYSACEGGKNLSGNKRVEIQYYDKTGDARLSFWLMGPGYLPMRETCDPAQWCASYYPGNEYLEPEDSPTIRKNEGSGTLRKEFDFGSPGYGINPDHFSAKWERMVYFKAGQYRFSLDHDDGAQVLIDNGTGPDNFSNCCGIDTKDVWLSEGNHFIKVRYREGTDKAYVRLWWETVQQCYSLTTSVTPVGSGTVSASPAGNCPVDTTRYLAGTNVQVTLNPASGYTAQGVTGDVYGLGNTANVLMNWDRNIIAYFVPSVTNTPTPTPTNTTAPPTATPTPQPSDLLNSFEASINGLNIRPATDNSATTITRVNDHATNGNWAAQLDFNHNSSVHSRATYQYDFITSVNVSQPRSASFLLLDHTVSAGAGAFSSSSYRARGTVGQIMDSARASSANFRLVGGYEAGSQAIPGVTSISLDWSRYNAIQFDIWTGQAMNIAIALGTGPTGTWYESARKPLANGNNAVQFDLKSSTWSANGQSNVAVANPNAVRYLAILIYPSVNGAGSVFVDNIQLSPHIDQTGTPTPTLTPTATRTSTPVPPTATNTVAPPTATRTNTPVPPTATSTPVPPTATFTATPGPYGITGIVAAAGDQSGFTLRAVGPMTALYTVPATGNINFTGLIAGSYQVTLSKTGCTDLTLPLTLPGGTGWILAPVCGYVAGTGSVSGLIPNAPDPTGFKVHIWGGSVNLYVNADGKGYFVVNSVPYGTYSITVEKPSCTAATIQVAFSSAAPIVTGYMFNVNCTATPVPTATVTNTPVPPTATNTTVPPTATRTNTPVPPTVTKTSVTAILPSTIEQRSTMIPVSNHEGLTLTVALPATVISTEVKAFAVITDTGGAPVGYTVLGHTFDLQFQDANGASVAPFTQPFTLTVAYGNAMDSAAQPAEVSLQAWHPDTGTWTVVPATVNADEHTITAVLSGPATLAVLRKEEVQSHQLYLPVIQQ